MWQYSSGYKNLHKNTVDKKSFRSWWCSPFQPPRQLRQRGGSNWTQCCINIVLSGVLFRLLSNIKLAVALTFRVFSSQIQSWTLKCWWNPINYLTLISLNKCFLSVKLILIHFNLGQLLKRATGHMIHCNPMITMDILKYTTCRSSEGSCTTMTFSWHG